MTTKQNRRPLARAFNVLTERAWMTPRCRATGGPTVPTFPTRPTARLIRDRRQVCSELVLHFSLLPCLFHYLSPRSGNNVRLRPASSSACLPPFLFFFLLLIDLLPALTNTKCLFKIHFISPIVFLLTSPPRLLCVDRRQNSPFSQTRVLSDGNVAARQKKKTGKSVSPVNHLFD